MGKWEFSNDFPPMDNPFFYLCLKKFERPISAFFLKK